MTGAHSVAQTEAHRLIEHLMILTNERVAELLERRRVPTIYRVHEQPDPERIRRMIEQLAALDIPTPALPDSITPSRRASLPERRAGWSPGRPSAGVTVARRIHRLCFARCKQAHYADRNLGHAGLGSQAYCHFTSPIRRFPDLIAHRSLLSAIGAGEDPPRAEALAELAAHCSERERDATRTERDADSVCASFLLERELFERGPDTRFEGEVSGVVGAGAFVRFGGALADVYEGFLPARRIGGRERYELDRTETMLVGARGGGAIRIGDPVAVTRRPGRGAPRPCRPASLRLMAKRSKAPRTPVSGDVATNRRAGHKFQVLESMEAGIELQGSEVKSLRDGKAQINEAYAVVDRGRCGCAAPTSRPTFPPRTRTTSRIVPASSSSTGERSSA